MAEQDQQPTHPCGLYQIMRDTPYISAPFQVACHTPPPPSARRQVKHQATTTPGASGHANKLHRQQQQQQQQEQQMAVGFRRRLTALSVPKASSLLRRTRHKKLSYTRVRCNSLPGRFHPVVASLHESANALIVWTEEPAQAFSPAWVADGAARLGRLLSGLTDLLHHPQARDPLRHSHRGNSKPAAPWAERLLDDLLLLADAHGCVREALLARRQLLAEAHAALRRRDAARLAAALRARRRADRDLSRLASTLRCLSHRSSPGATSASAAEHGGEAAVADAVAAATCAAAAASAAIFAGLASASASSSASRAMPSPLASVVSPAKVAAAPVWWVADLLRWRRRTVAVAAASESSGPGAKEQVPLHAECCSEEEEERQAAMERLRSLEDCVVAAENGCEQVYRMLVNARVSLLNVLTPCF